MSQENVEIVVGQFENTNARDWKAVMDAYDEEVVLVCHDEKMRAVMGPGVVGKEAVGKWFGDWFRTFDRDYRFEIEETRDLGDRVLMIATHHARGRTSGVPIEQQAGWIYTVRSEKIVRCDLYSSRTAAFEAAGLTE